MVLFPLHAHERSPIGLFPLRASTTVEGGMVGFITEKAGAPVGEPEVTLFTGGASPDPLDLVGLIDDSTSAPSSRGVTGIGLPLAPGITELTGTGGGPATYLASRKVTLWMDAGMFVTDTWDTTDSVLGTDLSTTTVGVNLSVDPAGTAGLLQVDVGDTRLGRFVRRLVGGLGPVDDFDSFFIPRVQPLPEGEVFMVFRFEKQ